MNYAFFNGKLLDGSRDMTPREGLCLLTQGEKIQDIRPMGDIPAGYEKIDLRGGYLMPGLVNLHVHLAGSGKPQKKQRDNEALVKKIMGSGLTRAVAYRMVCGFARDELLGGVTTIRTVGGLGDFDSRLRDDIAAGKRVGPRILAANEGISVPGGHMAGSVAIAAHSIDEALAHLDKCRAQGVDLVKLMITGGVLDAKEKGVPGELKMAPEMVRAVCDKAHAMGYQVAAHVESPEGVRVALENGVDTIEHGAKPDEEILRLFKERHAALVTTLSPALPYALFDRSVSHASEMAQFNGMVVFQGIQDCAKACLEAGIPVGLGTDTGCAYVTHTGTWREPLLFQKYCGVSNAFALYTATLGNAKIAKIDNVTGSLEVGKAADMIAVEKNPLEDLHALRDVKLVVARGKRYDQPKVKRDPQVEEELDKFM